VKFGVLVVDFDGTTSEDGSLDAPPALATSAQRPRRRPLRRNRVDPGAEHGRGPVHADPRSGLPSHLLNRVRSKIEQIQLPAGYSLAWGGEDDSLPAVAMASLRVRGARTVVSHERGTGGSLLAILAGQAGYVGGILETADPLPVLDAHAVIRLALDPPDDRGRSRLVVAVDGDAAVAIAAQRLRAYGSGPARLRRAAFATLDLIRRG
jgi:hypothetical protein